MGCNPTQREGELPDDDFRRPHDDFRRFHADFRAKFFPRVLVPFAFRNNASGAGEKRNDAG